MAAGWVNRLDPLRQQVREVGDGDALAESARSVSGLAGVLRVWMTGSSPSTCCHSKDFFDP